MEQRLTVWDPLIRIFHWSLVLFFFLAYVTEDDFQTIHVYSGYALLGLIGFRLVWGFIGTHYARFQQFIYAPGTVENYFYSLFAPHSPRYLGHNPAGGYMVIALMLSISITGLLGLVLYATEGGGPLSQTFFAGWHSEWLEELHEIAANVCVLLISIHIFGVLVSSLKHRENLVKSMFTGIKPQRPGDIE